jgi:TPR repeat protein
MRKVAPYRSDEERVKLANEYQAAGKYGEAANLYELVFQRNPSADLAFNLARCHRGLGAGRDHQMNQSAFDWHLKATELGHAEAPFWAGLGYAQGEVVEKNLGEANRFLGISCDRGFPKAIEKRNSGGFS